MEVAMPGVSLLCPRLFQKLSLCRSQIFNGFILEQVTSKISIFIEDK